jgi:hypothetical protein
MSAVVISQLHSSPVTSGSNFHQPWGNRATNVSLCETISSCTRKWRGLSKVPPCGLRFFGKSLKSDELNPTPHLKLTNRPSIVLTNAFKTTRKSVSYSSFR